MTDLQDLPNQIKQCSLCTPFLTMGARPILSVGVKSKILIISQAPGRKVHDTGIPWNDKSGERLRSWLDMDKNIFYDTNKVSLMPMGFCYPGKDNQGDLPPRKECKKLWHPSLLSHLNDVKLTLLVGQYAQQNYLRNSYRSLTENVKNIEEGQAFIALPHPSPRNFIWLNKNPWFEQEILPVIKNRIKLILDND